jgi:type IV pilus assembly protein PilE
MNNGITTQRRHGGFTLIELMIAIVIVAVLLAVALPTYQNQIIRGHRAAAKAEMMEIANRQQQFLLANRAFAPDLATLGYALPTEVAANYTAAITLDPNDVPSYVITFTGIGRQASDGDPLTINHQGVKTPADKWTR